MNIIIDATAQRGYPVGLPGFYGGTELYLHKLAAGLSKNHMVHVITPDLESVEHRAHTLFYWPPEAHPTSADAVVMIHNLENIDPYAADLLILASNGIGANLGPEDELLKGVDAIACFSGIHARLLSHQHQNVDLNKCHRTGLGVDLKDYSVWDPEFGSYLFPRETGIKVPGRFLYANAPERGLWNTLRIFELVQKAVPHASLHITYDWTRVFESYKWQANAISQQLWECKDMIKRIPHVYDRGALTRPEIIQEQLECEVHMYPSAPPNIGSQIHGITQMECAAAGCALILSDTEAFPELFSEGAALLPIPGAFLPEAERRCTLDDWAENAVFLLETPRALASSALEARHVAEEHTWDRVVKNWEIMLAELTSKEVSK